MSANLRGILAVLVASTAFVLNDALIKLVSAELPASEIIVLRGILATLMLIAGWWRWAPCGPSPSCSTPMMLLRVASAATATVFIVLSLRRLPLADRHGRAAGHAAGGDRRRRPSCMERRWAGSAGRRR